MRKSINWWWFLPVTGIVMPALLALIIQVDYIPYLPNHFVEGTNPLLVYALNFFIISVICLLFVLIKKIISNVSAKRIIYIIIGIACIYLFTNQFYSKYEIAGNDIPRRYIGTRSVFEGVEPMFVYYVAGYSIFIVIIFLFFFARNFPIVKTNLQKTTITK